ncbi:MAG TPA: 30S ribosomal protein S9 [Candidatus Ratteibacteria bacterium]|nr:30S ribosomal protein S9 [bacterium]HRR95278.1 30S ribosomal protein S9 [Candidatus Ratteibacteria bacterium]
MEKGNLTIAVGRRKTSRAIVKFKEGKGEIKINNKEISTYFPLFYQKEEVLKPLSVTDTKDKFDINVKVEGGGITGQIDATKLAIARALIKYDPSLTPKLREFGLLTRDPRMPERKKYGQKKARKKFQWTKR